MIEEESQHEEAGQPPSPPPSPMLAYRRVDPVDARRKGSFAPLSRGGALSLALAGLPAIALAIAIVSDIRFVGQAYCCCGVPMQGGAIILGIIGACLADDWTNRIAAIVSILLGAGCLYFLLRAF